MPDITGIDTVKSSLTWQLDGDSGDYYDENTDLENLILTGSDPINGTGNSLNNILVGNLADNELFGFSVTTHCVVDLGTTPLRVGKALTCFTVKQATTLSKVGLLG